MQSPIRWLVIYRTTGSPAWPSHPLHVRVGPAFGHCMAVAFFSTRGARSDRLFIWLLSFAVLVRAALTLYHVPHMALGRRTQRRLCRTHVGGAVENPVGDGRLAGGYWSWESTIFFPASDTYPNGLLNPAGYPAFAVFSSFLMCLTTWYSAWGTRKQIPRLPAPPEHPEPFSIAAISREFVVVWKNPSFRALIVGFSLFAIAISIVSTLGTHINVFYWASPATRYQPCWCRWPWASSLAWQSLVSARPSGQTAQLGRCCIDCWRTEQRRRDNANDGFDAGEWRSVVVWNRLHAAAWFRARGRRRIHFGGLNDGRRCLGAISAHRTQPTGHSICCNLVFQEAGFSGRALAGRCRYRSDPISTQERSQPDCTRHNLPPWCLEPGCPADFVTRHLRIHPLSNHPQILRGIEEKN